MSIVLLFLLVILISFVFFVIKDREIFTLILYFFIAVNVIISILMVYFVSYIKYASVINIEYVLMLMNYIILISFLFEKNEDSEINR